MGVINVINIELSTQQIIGIVMSVGGVVLCVIAAKLAHDNMKKTQQK
jgi:hypothetical protein